MIRNMLFDKESCKVIRSLKTHCQLSPFHHIMMQCVDPLSNKTKQLKNLSVYRSSL